MEALEIQVKPAPKGTWRDAIGFAKHDELFDEAMRLGAEWREKANREGLEKVPGLRLENWLD